MQSLFDLVSMRRASIVVLAAWLLMVVAPSFGPAWGQAPYLVKDINTGANSQAGSNPFSLTSVGGSVYFVANDPVAGGELWKSDGTSAGTTLVRDIYPGDGSGYPTSLTNVNGRLFFSALDPAHINELWKTDGTPAGTFLVKVINPGGSGSNPTSLTNVAGTLFFAATDPVAGNELWKSDGTEGGTVVVKDINPGADSSSPAALVNVNGTLFFSAFDPIHGQELWKSDGTEAGTVLVADISPGTDGSYPNVLFDANGTLFFSAFDSVNGGELWKSDGSEAGTVLVADIAPGPDSSYLSKLTHVNGTLFFVTFNGTTSASELWKSDGTGSGTVLVKGGYASAPDSLVSMNGTLYFAAYDFTTSTFELWRSDGTTDGTVIVNPGGGWQGPSALTLMNGMLFFGAFDPVNGQELWKSDGTDGGTVLVANIHPGADGSFPVALANANGTLFFNAADPIHGPELWKSDGTSGGTVLVRDINEGDSSIYFAGGADLNGTLYFPLPFPDPAFTELWESNGTASGTVPVGPPGQYSIYSDGVPLNVNGTLFFAALDATHGVELWKSDGTAGGTTLVKDINPGADWGNPAPLVGSNGTVFFAASEPDHGSELWKSDGTEAGTVLVKDITAGLAGSSLNALTDANGTLFFVANYFELWKSDGTEAGTVPVTSASLYIIGPSLTNVNGTLFFRVFDFGTFAYVLWKSDGSEAGTVPVKGGLVNPLDLTNVNGTLFFTEPDSLNDISSLWKSDGTEAGTGLVSPAADWNSPSSLTNVNGTLFFTSFDFGTFSFGLWKSDGTEAGTVLVKGGLVSPIDFTSVSGTLFFTDPDQATFTRKLWSSDGTEANTSPVGAAAGWDEPSSLVNVDGTLFFAASDPTHGVELWKSDGTEAGTVLVKDIVPGPNGSSPLAMGIVNGVLYLSAYDPVHGRELSKSDGTEAGTTFVADISPGQTGSNPLSLVVSGSKAYFCASGSVAGEPLNRELWAFDVCAGINCQCVDADGDGYGAFGGADCPAGPQPDCDDHSAAIHPGASDVTCDGVDENCNGLVDEGSPGVCQCPTPGPGLVGYWPGDGTAFDVQGGNNGTLVGGTSFVPGQVGQAFQFDGINDYVGGIGTAASYSFIQNTGVFTIAAWIKLDDPSALVQQAIMGNCGTSAAKGHGFLWENTDGLNRMRVFVANGTPGVPVIDSSSGINAITTTGWHHVAAVGDGTHVTFWIDGVGTLGSGTFGTMSTGDSTNPDLSIAAIPSVEPFKGRIDEVQIYNRALDAGAIQAIYAYGSQPCHCTDRDADGYGAEGGLTCPAGTQVDCDDGALAVHPGAPDATCNGVDDNCNGQVDEAFGGVCQCSEVGSGLISWWPGDGNASDIRGGHNGTLENGASYAAGEVGQAFSLDGINDYVGEIGAASTYSFIQNTGVFSIVAWIRIDDPTVLAQYALTGNISSSGQKGHIFRWDNTDGLGRLNMHVAKGNSGEVGISATSGIHVITTSGWHHVAAVGDGLHVTFWIDGVGTVVPDVFGTLSTGDSSLAGLTIGDCDGSGQCLFKGQIDEMQIYNRALGGSEINAIYASSSVGMCHCTDADGDGYGTEGGVSCASGNLQDCNDGSVVDWRTPIEVTNLTLGSPGSTTLSWSGQALVAGPGVTYDVLRGAVATPVGSGSDTCEGSAIIVTSTVDSAVPAVGTGYRYLVRAHNSCGTGTYGTRSNGAPRVSAVCP